MAEPNERDTRRGWSGDVACGLPALRSTGWLPARRNGWPFVLALILLAALVVTVPVDYASPADPSGITPIYDAVECDDTADVDRDRVITQGQPVGEPVPTVAGDPGSVVVPPVVTSVNVAVSTMAAGVRATSPRCDRLCLPLSPPQSLATLRVPAVF